jgi:hypothetical protein
MCDGKNRLKAGAGMVPFPRGKESEAGNRVDFSSLGKNRRVFEITNLIIRKTFHHGFGYAPRF